MARHKCHQHLQPLNHELRSITDSCRIKKINLTCSNEPKRVTKQPEPDTCVSPPTSPVNFPLITRKTFYLAANPRSVKSIASDHVCGTSKKQVFLLVGCARALFQFLFVSFLECLHHGCRGADDENCSVYFQYFSHGKCRTVRSRFAPIAPFAGLKWTRSWSSG